MAPQQNPLEQSKPETAVPVVTIKKSVFIAGSLFIAALFALMLASLLRMPKAAQPLTEPAGNKAFLPGKKEFHDFGLQNMVSGLPQVIKPAAPFDINKHLPHLRKLNKDASVKEWSAAAEMAMVHAVSRGSCPDIASLLQLGYDINGLYPALLNDGKSTLPGILLASSLEPHKFIKTYIFLCENGADLNIQTGLNSSLCHELVQKCSRSKNRELWKLIPYSMAYGMKTDSIPEPSFKLNPQFEEFLRKVLSSKTVKPPLKTDKRYPSSSSKKLCTAAPRCNDSCRKIFHTYLTTLFPNYGSEEFFSKNVYRNGDFKQIRLFWECGADITPQMLNDISDPQRWNFLKSLYDRQLCTFSANGVVVRDAKYWKLLQSVNSMTKTGKRKTFFVIGDSISWYYGQYLGKMLSPFADYDRKGGSKKMTALADMTDGVNGGHSGMVVTYIKGVLNESFFNTADYLVLNCGIHDTKPTRTGKRQVDIETYRKNLETIIKLAPMPIIWVTTTPFNLPCGEYAERQQHIDLYNLTARKIMAKHNIPVIDLDKFTRTLGLDLYLNGGDPCHFNASVQALQAAFICSSLLKITGVQ